MMATKHQLDNLWGESEHQIWNQKVVLTREIDVLHDTDIKDINAIKKCKTSSVSEDMNH